jgi:Cadherin-like beta sandwich domain
MQFGGTPIDAYLSTIRVTRAALRGKIKAVLTGHNDWPLPGETYLSNIEAAAQKLVDQGPAVLIPSYRPVGGWQVMVSDRMQDPNWAAINVNKERCLSTTSDKIATLSNIEVAGATLNGRFSLDSHSYAVEAPRGAETVKLTPIATSSRCQSLTVDGASATSGEPVGVKLNKPRKDVTIVVTSPDGSVHTYAVSVSAR